MTLKRNAAGTQTTVATKMERRDTGAWVAADIIKRRLSGAWTTAWQRVLITAQAIDHSPPSGTATAGYRLNTSGIAESRQAAAYTTIESWLSFGNSSGYECRATLNSGTSPSGSALGSWLALSASREWTLTKATTGNVFCSL